MARYGNIVLSDFNFDTEYKGSWYVDCNDKLALELNILRKLNGQEDVPSEYNEVYYNFYLEVNSKDKTIQLIGIVHCSEIDDGEMYVLPLNDKEEIELIKLILNQIGNEQSYIMERLEIAEEEWQELEEMRTSVKNKLISNKKDQISRTVLTKEQCIKALNNLSIPTDNWQSKELQLAENNLEPIEFEEQKSINVIKQLIEEHFK